MFAEFFIRTGCWSLFLTVRPKPMHRSTGNAWTKTDGPTKSDETTQF